MSYTDRIKPKDNGLTSYLEDLRRKDYQIPTFQREVVWKEDNVKKLWDSIYKFYPLGSILIWLTDVKLQNHREVCGHIIADPDFSRTEYRYILDGQQRTTSLLTSLYGGKIENRLGFDPTIYVDLTVSNSNETDDECYKERFLFWQEIDDRGGKILRNVSKKRKYVDGLIVKLMDVLKDFGKVEKRLVDSTHGDYKDYDNPIRQELRKLKAILDNYRISFIEVKGIQVAEVCQIFERINQAGKPLNIFDIVVAKTFQPKTETAEGFYLREMIDGFREANTTSEFMKIGDGDYLQILAVLISYNVPGSGVQNITDRYLNEIKTEHITFVWDEGKKAILKTFDFFENHLHLKTPYLIPFRYFYLTLASYFYKNRNPDYEFLKKYFWFNSFHDDDLLSNTTDLFEHIDFLQKQKSEPEIEFEEFIIDKQKLRDASYSSKGRLSRAILSLYANQQPRDWEHCDREVLAQSVFFSTDVPNLHHIFPTNSEYVLSSKHKNKVDNDTLMNIAYLTQITNQDILCSNPLTYMKDYDKPAFEAIMPTHLLPKDILEWSRGDQMPENGLDVFVEKRVELVLKDLRKKLIGIKFKIIDKGE